MPPRIQLLSETLVNQIAAGEVVERPASVVKELIENSLDAGATQVKVEIHAGGRSLIRVTDNGCGMTRDDALLSVERHATSKISTSEDLFSIGTLGFRGEALAAIGSVSRLEIITRTAEEEVGLRLTVSGGRVGPLSQVGCPVGTSIEIRDLFFNTPARLKFLKSATLETSHIIDVITRTAMAQEGVAFTLNRGDETLVRASQGSRGRDRVFELLGKRVGQHLYPFAGSKLNMRLSGLLSSPELSRSSWTGFYLFVNERPIRDRRVMRAVASAYQGLLPRGRYPVVVLRLTLPPGEVDVNVHPGKLEARFAQSRVLGDLVISALKAVLDRRPWAKVSDLASLPTKKSVTPYKLPLTRPSSGGSEEAEPGQKWVLKRGGDGFVADGPLLSYGRGRSQGEGAAHPNAPGQGPTPPTSPEPEERESEDADIDDDAPPLGKADPLEEDRTLKASPDWRPEPKGRRPDDDVRRFSRIRVIGQYLGRYLICQEDDRLVLIDRQVATELILETALKGEGEGRSQPLLIPRVGEVEASQVAALKGIVPGLRSLGLEIDPFGGESFAIKALPSALGDRDPLLLLKALAAGAKSFSEGDDLIPLVARAGARDLKGSLKPSEYPHFLNQLDDALLKGAVEGPVPLLVNLSRHGVARLFEAQRGGF